MLALIASMRRRSRTPHPLRTLDRARAILEQALEQLGAPSFVIDAAGHILEVNSEGRALLESQHREITDALRNVVKGRPSDVEIKLTAVSEHGAAICWIAVAKPDTRASAAVSIAAARWSLTRRQRDVLDLLVRGYSNITIAKELGVSVRAIEQHLTAVFDRAGVDSRAGLVALVLGRP